MILKALRIDKGYAGGAAHSGTCIHNYGSCISILYILRKVIFVSTQWYKYNFNLRKL